jgi:L-fuconate dehydratase
VTDTFRSFELTDLRFPTSRDRDGSDAMNPDPDYSSAYLKLATGAGDAGYGFVFTIGRGNEVQVAAIRALERHLVGRDVDQVLSNLGELWRELTTDSQLRWLGPDKGVEHMAVGAVINALWDLRARRAGLPLWQLLAELEPAQVVDLVDFTYLEDALTPAEALAILQTARPDVAERTTRLLRTGYPAYTTSAGWLGYSDDKVVRLALEAVEAGFDHLKLKVGADSDDDIRRCELVRATVGPDIRISVDANQRWGVSSAIENIRRLAHVDLWWVEEPTSPDDVLGHKAIRDAVAPMRIATGEHCANRVLFKQLLSSGAVDVCQIDACRVAGVNENIAVLLMAAKFGVPVCPHAGGVGLCEVVQHLAMFDYVAVSGSTENRWIEFVDHLHEHFETPVVVEGARYRAPSAPGSGARVHDATLEAFSYPDGPAWRTYVNPQSHGQVLPR